jgi:hypothetical protein
MSLMTGSLLAGLLGPLVAVAATWIVVSRTHRRNPAGVHAVMLGAFGVKAIFFATYAIAMVKGFGVDVATFGLSFAVCFITLYGIEAALFARLFRTSGPSPSGAEGAR